MLKQFNRARRFIAVLAIVCIAFCDGGAMGLSAIAEAASKPPAQSERRIDMSFPSAQLGFILQSLGSLYGANFSISAAAAAQVVTLEFKQAKFEEVLEMIKLTASVKITQVSKNAYVVVSLEEGDVSTKLMTEKEKELKAVTDRLSKGIMKTFVLHYVGASDVSGALNSLLGESSKSAYSVSVLGSSEGGSGGGGGDSAAGSSGSENREYATIIVYAANNEIMDYVTKVIAEIDAPKPMVEVEAVFVEVASNKNTDIGFDWSILPDPLEFVESSIGGVAVGSLEELTPIYRKTTLGQMRRTSPATASVQANLVAGNSRGRVLSNPRIRVMSGYKAGFISETQVPIMNKDSDGEIKTEYKNVGVNLNILPVVLDNNQIYLTIQPSVSSITDTVTLGDTQAPQIAERSAETTVLMRDGETMVIGGLLSDRDIKTMSKVPLLWKIPLFGELFKSENTTKEYSSISVYIRLKLIKDYMGEDKRQVNLPDATITKLLTNHKPMPQAANQNGSVSGAMSEKVEVQGVIPVPMNKAKAGNVNMEIVPNNDQIILGAENTKLTGKAEYAPKYDIEAALAQKKLEEEAKAEAAQKEAAEASKEVKAEYKESPAKDSPKYDLEAALERMRLEEAAKTADKEAKTDEAAQVQAEPEINEAEEAVPAKQAPANSMPAIDVSEYLY